jgi:uncharacterized membrane protein
MLSLPMVKLGVQFMTGAGVSKIIGDIVKNNVTVVTTFEKVAVKTSSLVLGSMIIGQTSDHIEQVLNDIVAWHEKKDTDTKTEK